MTYSARRPVDMEHLNRYTGGERALNEEVLRLFATSCTTTLEELEDLVEACKLPQPSPELAKAWAHATHTLKGAARTVGAFDLAEIAEKAEKCGPADRLASIVAIETIKAQAEILHGFVADFLRAPA